MTNKYWWLVFQYLMFCFGSLALQMLLHPMWVALGLASEAPLAIKVLIDIPLTMIAGVVFAWLTLLPLPKDP